jgi:hypothetical protein
VALAIVIAVVVAVIVITRTTTLVVVVAVPVYCAKRASCAQEIKKQREIGHCDMVKSDVFEKKLLVPLDVVNFHCFTLYK